jgi:hypothetical protein
MRVTRLFTTSGAATSDIFEPKMISNEDGIFQVQVHSGTVNVVLQGRLSPAAPWFDVALNAAGDTVASLSDYFTVPLFPQMRVVITGIGSVSAWIGD